MEIITSWLNTLADLPTWGRIILGIGLGGIGLVFFGYLWGKRPGRVLDKALKAELPEWHDARGWLLFFSTRSPRGKSVVTAVAGFILLALALVLAFPRSQLVGNLLGRNRIPIVTPHLFVQHYENYTHLYFDITSERTAAQVEDRLTFQNVSGRILTHFRIAAFAYTDVARPAEFAHTYSVETGSSYIGLGEFEVGSLNTQDKYVLSLRDIYDRYRHERDLSEGQLNQLLFPGIGGSSKCENSKVTEKYNQAFTTKPQLLQRYIKIQPIGMNAACGLPMKLVVNYQFGAEAYSVLFMGGTYYYGVSGAAGMIPHPVAVASFVKPRFSIMRRTSGSEDKVIDMDLEILGDSFAPEPRDPNLMGMYFVFQPKDDVELDQQLAITVHRAMADKLADQAQRLAEHGQVSAANELVTRVLNLQPNDPRALALRAYLRSR